MNALYKLSQSYGKGMIDKNSYKRERANVINAILNGELSNQVALTNVPTNKNEDSQKRSRKNTSHNAADFAQIDQEYITEIRPEKRTKNARAPQTQKGINGWFWLLMIIILGVALLIIQKRSVLELVDKHSPDYYQRVADIYQLLPFSNSSSDNTNLEKLQAVWMQIKQNKAITQADIDTAKKYWGRASVKEKRAFEVILALQLSNWEQDFEKELETGLLYELSDQVGIKVY